MTALPMPRENKEGVMTPLFLCINVKPENMRIRRLKADVSLVDIRYLERYDERLNTLCENLKFVWYRVKTCFYYSKKNKLKRAHISEYSLLCFVIKSGNNLRKMVE